MARLKTTPGGLSRDYDSMGQTYSPERRPSRDDSSPSNKLLQPYPVLRRPSESPLSSEFDEFSDSPSQATKRLLILCACSLVGFVMNVLVSVVAPFFPTEAKKFTGASTTTIGLIFAIFPLTNMLICPLINMAILRVGRKTVLMLGLATLAASTMGFGMSKTIPLWCATRVMQGIGSAAAGATYYAILSDMYVENLGFIIGIQEAVTGLGYMVGPMLGAALFSLGGFRLPFLVLSACPLLVLVVLPPLLRDGHNFEPNHQLAAYGSPSLFRHEETTHHHDAWRDFTMLEQKEEGVLEAAARSSMMSRVLSLPFVVVALGGTLATCGFAFVEPVLSEHLMAQLSVSASTSGMLMGIPSVSYILAAPVAGWLGEKWGYRPVLFMGCCLFALAMALMGPAAPPLPPLALSSTLRWAIQVSALVLLGLGSAFGSITTLPDMKHIAGPGSTDLVAGLFNNVVVPAGEVTGPVIGGLLTQVLGSFKRASFYFGCGFLGFGTLLVVLHVSGIMPWKHHKDEAVEAYLVKRRFLREASLQQICTMTTPADPTRPAAT